MKKTLKIVGIISSMLVLAFGLLIGYWRLRPNRAQVDTTVVKETWSITSDNAHNSNTI